MTIDPIGLRDLGLARQLLAGGIGSVGDAALDAVGNLPPQRNAGACVLQARGTEPVLGIGKIMGLSRNLHRGSL
jgi:hypothetical protein